jgi:AcrR family transcriptional regulator
VQKFIRMTQPENKTNADPSTEEKIKEAARVVFTRKGYAATKVRDIAAQANINLALVNYYFRSKEKLFQLIMAETIQQLFEKLKPIINDESTTIVQKFESVADHYMDLLIANPDFPLFIVNELMTGSTRLPIMTDNGKMFFNSHFVKQLAALRMEGKITFHPINIMMNMIGMIIFPFLARPLVLRSGIVSEQEFRGIIEERKKLIPLWLTQIVNL